jgi:magnesium and cobalt transporter
MTEETQPTFLERLSAFLLRQPEDREELLTFLRSAHAKKILDADALSIIEGALTASEIAVREVMVPRARMQVIDVDTPLDDIIAQVKRTAHSRFPVIAGNRDEVIGLILAKDLLHVRNGGTEFRLRDWLRPAVFIPESKRLNVLLREFRVSRNHMAVVLDEYAGVSGLITIEDVLEQIVGDIEDEYDFDEADDNVKLNESGRYRVKAHTAIEDFNAVVGTNFSSEEYKTVGGLILSRLGRVPERNELIEVDGVQFRVLRADSRRLYTLIITVPQHADESVG